MQSSIGAHYSKQKMIKFSQYPNELAEKSNFFKLAVLQSDSMKGNYEGLIFTNKKLKKTFVSCCSFNIKS